MVWLGTFGHKATESLLRQKEMQYPDYYKADDFISQYGQKVHDCSGLIKGYLFCKDAESFYSSYDIEIDTGINYDNCTEKGELEDMPDIPGILLFKPGHVGVYIGNGKVIEARGHDYGVVETNLVGRGWTKWGKCKFIEYVDDINVTDFQDGQELEALDYLVEQGRILDKEYALKKLVVINNEKWYIIKWANDVKKLNSLT